MRIADADERERLRVELVALDYVRAGIERRIAATYDRAYYRRNRERINAKRRANYATKRDQGGNGAKTLAASTG